MFCAAIFMAWSYRHALRRLHDDPDRWIEFVLVWLPTAVGIGLLIAYGVPAIQRRLRRRGFRFGR